MNLTEARRDEIFDAAEACLPKQFASVFIEYEASLNEDQMSNIIHDPDYSIYQDNEFSFWESEVRAIAMTEAVDPIIDELRSQFDDEEIDEMEGCLREHLQEKLDALDSADPQSDLVRLTSNPSCVTQFIDTEIFTQVFTALSKHGYANAELRGTKDVERAVGFVRALNVSASASSTKPFRISIPMTKANIGQIADALDHARLDMMLEPRFVFDLDLSLLSVERNVIGETAYVSRTPEFLVIRNPYLYFGDPRAGDGWLTDMLLDAEIIVHRSEVELDTKASGYDLTEIFGMAFDDKPDVTVF